MNEYFDLVFISNYWKNWKYFFCLLLFYISPRFLLVIAYSVEHSGSELSEINLFFNYFHFFKVFSKISCFSFSIFFLFLKYLYIFLYLHLFLILL